MEPENIVDNSRQTTISHSSFVNNQSVYVMPRSIGSKFKDLFLHSGKNIYTFGEFLFSFISDTILHKKP